MGGSIFNIRGGGVHVFNISMEELLIDNSPRLDGWYKETRAYGLRLVQVKG